ncbi:ABC transporter permease subunit [Marinicella litoralis]|uniref:Oligopeptide transport system permease protein n=1 Tax=Marinicella litoralis TaxID=644220 RepID=A0A4R6XY92_9GAMM|nr:ABC transporter permease subunit [Marinicella litoralis]TDR23264.1 oligopeptide transport system permease protein [Marinicella litoralis]
MIQMLVKRLLWGIPVLWLILTLTFFLLRAAPGGPFDQERELSAEVEQLIAQKYQLDQPLMTQYGNYLKSAVQGDLGPSFQYADYSVNQLIALGLPVSLKIGFYALLLALFFGVLLGGFAATYANRWPDLVAMIVAVIGISTPNFVIAPLLILGFSVHMQWLPVGGWSGGQWPYLVLPVVTLSFPFVAAIARLVRSGLLEVLSQPFIQTARAKGLSTYQVLFKHALRPAMLPVVSYLGPAAVGLMTGSVVIEQIFGIPGMGRYFVQGALNRDYTLVLGVVLVIGIMMMLFNLLVDMLYRWLDPRVAKT